jgi:hypothetical protein
MKRFLNEVKAVSIEAFDSNKNEKFKLAASETYVPSQNELLIGMLGGTTKGLFVALGTNKELYLLSNDDFAYDFLRNENIRLNNALTGLTTSISTVVGTIPTIEDQDGGI